MSAVNDDGNIIGRVSAVVLLAAAGFGLHKLNCGTGSMCALMQTDSCCTGGEGHAKAKAPKAAPAAVPSKTEK